MRVKKESSLDYEFRDSNVKIHGTHKDSGILKVKEVL